LQLIQPLPQQLLQLPQNQPLMLLLQKEKKTVGNKK
jgi:hypothetical protein